MSPNALHPAQLALLSEQVQLPTLARLAVTFAVMVTVWDMNSRSRKSLARLEPYELDDIGLTDTQARKECNKWFCQR